MKACIAVIVLFASMAVVAQSPTADREAIRALDKQWSQAAGAKDLDKAVSFYAPDAYAMPFNAPAAKTPEQIRAMWKGMMAAPGYALKFGPTRIEVAKSGDMAYDIGTFELKENDPQGKPSTIIGKYVVVWKKIGGQWKAVADIFNTDK